jgi:KaiC/GvpD/RAD55 family RecA-like ATPase
VSQHRSAPYELGELPLGPVSAGTTLLVTGPGRLGTDLAADLVLAGDDHDEGMVFVTTNDSGRRLVAECSDRRPGLDTSRLGVVDASGAADTDTDTDTAVGEVSNTSDLTGISIQFSRVYSALYGRGTRRIRSCFDSVSMLLLYTDFRTTVRFVHTMVGRVSKTDGLGVFVLDPSMHDDQAVYTLARLCDGHLEVRPEGGERAIRVEGVDGPADWTPLR